jgi:hypothetical protein
MWSVVVTAQSKLANVIGAELGMKTKRLYIIKKKKKKKSNKLVLLNQKISSLTNL